MEEQLTEEEKLIVRKYFRIKAKNRQKNLREKLGEEGYSELMRSMSKKAILKRTKK